MPNFKVQQQLPQKLEFLKQSKPFKDTHREKAQSNKTPSLRKSTNMGIWAVGISNQIFVRGSLTEKKNFKKNKVVTGKTPLFVIGPFSTHHSICLNFGF